MEYQVPDTRIKNSRSVDWSRYGLRNADSQSSEQFESSVNNDLNSDLYQTGANELFAQEYVSIFQHFINLRNFKHTYCLCIIV